MEAEPREGLQVEGGSPGVEGATPGRGWGGLRGQSETPRLEGAAGAVSSGGRRGEWGTQGLDRGRGSTSSPRGSREHQSSAGSAFGGRRQRTAGPTGSLPGAPGARSPSPSPGRPARRAPRLAPGSRVREESSRYRAAVGWPGERGACGRGRGSSGRFASLADLALGSSRLSATRASLRSRERPGGLRGGGLFTPDLRSRRAGRGTAQTALRPTKRFFRHHLT